MAKKEKRRKAKKTYVWLVLFLFIISLSLLLVIPEDVSHKRYNDYVAELEYIEDRAKGIAYGEGSELDVGIYTPQTAMQELYELEKEFEEIKHNIETDRGLNDIHSRSIETWILGAWAQLELEKISVFKYYYVGANPTEAEERAYFQFASGITKEMRNEMLEQIRLE